MGIEEALEVFTELLPRLWINANDPFVSLQDESSGWAEHLPLSWERAEALDKLRGSQSQQVLLHRMHHTLSLIHI